jgi:hypothetical protein
MGSASLGEARGEANVGFERVAAGRLRLTVAPGSFKLSENVFVKIPFLKIQLLKMYWGVKRCEVAGGFSPSCSPSGSA